MAVQPLFDFTPAAEREEDETGPFIENKPTTDFGGKFKLQARGEGSRTRYDPRAGRIRRPERQGPNSIEINIGPRCEIEKHIQGDPSGR